MHPIWPCLFVPLALAALAVAAKAQPSEGPASPVASQIVPSDNQAGSTKPASDGVSQGSSAPEITDPIWKKSPYGAWADDYLPERSVRTNTIGEATVSCIATAAGALAECRVLRESPPDAEFGAAATQVLMHASLKPLTASGAPVAGRPYTQTFRYAGVKRGAIGPIYGHWAR
jgi:TonB family protein